LWKKASSEANIGLMGHIQKLAQNGNFENLAQIFIFPPILIILTLETPHYWPNATIRSRVIQFHNKNVE